MRALDDVRSLKILLIVFYRFYSRFRWDGEQMLSFFLPSFLVFILTPLQLTNTHAHAHTHMHLRPPWWTRYPEMWISSSFGKNRLRALGHKYTLPSHTLLLWTWQTPENDRSGIRATEGKAYRFMNKGLLKLQLKFCRLLLSNNIWLQG